MVFISEPHCTRVPVPGMLLRRQEFPNSNRIPFIMKSFELHNVVEDSGNEWKPHAGNFYGIAAVFCIRAPCITDSLHSAVFYCLSVNQLFSRPLGYPVPRSPRFHRYCYYWVHWHPCTNWYLLPEWFTLDILVGPIWSRVLTSPVFWNLLLHLWACEFKRREQIGPSEILVVSGFCRSFTP